MATLELPNGTTPGTVDDAWLEEPAKRIGAFLGKIIAFLTVVLLVVGAITDLLPEDVRVEVLVGVGIVGAVVTALTRIQAILTRDRVYSPATVSQTFGDPDYGGGNVAYPAHPASSPTSSAGGIADDAGFDDGDHAPEA